MKGKLAALGQLLLAFVDESVSLLSLCAQIYHASVVNFHLIISFSFNLRGCVLVSEPYCISLYGHVAICRRTNSV